MPLIIGAKSATASGLTIANSCRFNHADSATLSKTSSSSSEEKLTISTWIKRSYVGEEGLIGNTSSGTNWAMFYFDGGNRLQFASYISASYVMRYTTNRVFNDVGAWYHLVGTVDISLASPEVKLYVNGEEQTDLKYNVTPSQSADIGWFNAWDFAIASNFGTGRYLGGYLSEVCYIEGSIYPASSFGEFNEDSPTIWQPKSADDISELTFGTNGFYLNFEDSANLGADVSGNSNDLTENNLDATDQATDTPTNNFATLNPLDNYYMGGTFSQGNTYWVTGSSEYAGQPATVGLAAGKWYWEVKVVADDAAPSEIIGIMSEEPTANSDQLGSKATDYGYYGNDGDVDNNGSGTTYGDTYTVGDIIGVALDLTNNKIYWSKNSVWQDSGDPTSGATGTGAVSITAPASTPLRFYFPAFGYINGSATATFGVNFGGSSGFTISSAASDANGYGNFEYAPPSGYLALCTKNLGSDGG